MLGLSILVLGLVTQVLSLILCLVGILLALLLYILKGMLPAIQLKSLGLAHNGAHCKELQT